MTGAGGDVSFGKTAVAYHGPGRHNIVAVPNPVIDLLTVRSSNPEFTSVMKLIDMTGRVLLSKETIQGQVVFSTAHLPAGTYLLQWMDDGAQKSTLITKQ